MRVTLQYFDDCPNWRTTESHLRRLAAERGDVDLVLEHVGSTEAAERLEFHGSPSVLVDGVDPFLGGGTAVGLSCRLYRTPEGLAGSPTVDQLRAVLDQF